jgi:hypothetical protein
MVVNVDSDRPSAFNGGSTNNIFGNANPFDVNLIDSKGI